MSEYQITYWRDLPSLVTARDGETVSKIELPPRFLEKIDQVAMDEGLTGSDEYLEGWRRGEWIAGEGKPGELAAAVAARLEQEFPGMNLYERLDRGDLILGDGAMGTMLQEVGLDDGGAPELWNVERPDPVAEILQGYAESGAQYLTTNTFGGTAPRLQLHGLDERAEELSRAGAEVARGVADRFGIMVAGDVGPTGEILFPLGVLEQDEAQRLFEVQIRGLVAGGADFLLIETMSALEEVEAAVLAGQAVAPELPIAVTMSFDTNLRTMMGVTPAAAVQAVSGWGVRVVGANCGRGPDEIETIMGQMAGSRPDGVHLMAQSNAGLPKLHGDTFAYDGTPEVMAGYARRARELGIAVIGGCCGSTPAHIAAMRDALAVSA